MPLTTEQRAALLAEIRDDPLTLGLRTQGHARAAKSLDYHVWNSLRGAEDGADRLTAIECVGATLSDVSAILDELEA